VNGSVFKRRLPSGTVSWCYSFIAGKDEKGKRIVNFKGGYETRGAAGEALRDAIKEYEKAHGKITKRRGVLGGVIWGYEFGGDKKSGFSDQQAATDALAEAVRRRAATEEAEAKAQLKLDPTLGEFIDTWLKDHAARALAPKTLERYRDFAAYIKHHLGEIRINDLTTAAIQNMVHRLSDCGGMITEAHPNGRPLAAKTVRHIATMLHTALSEADRLGILTIRHPMENKRVKLPPLPKRKPRIVESKEKLKALFDRARDTRQYAFIVTASASGCRRGELLALQWPDFNAATGELCVTKSLEQTKAGLRVKSTKSGKDRKFVLPEAAVAILEEQRAEQENDKRLYGSDYHDHGLIFCQPNGDYYSPDRMGARVKELMVKAGLEGVSLHSLRHTFATEMLHQGVPLAEVSKRLGHADQNITLGIYSHAVRADDRAAAKVWNDAMADVIDVSKNPAEVRSTAKYCTEGPKTEAFAERKTG